MNYDEKTCICALGKALGYEPRRAHAIINEFGSACAFFEMSIEERGKVLPFIKWTVNPDPALLESTAQELALLEKNGGNYISIIDEGFPELLRECDDAPVGLYIRSTSAPCEIFNSRPAVAIVGTRDISPYGREWCRRIVEALSQASIKPLIVSGLALGTDITAHEAALETGLPTVAVLPTGIDAVYPVRHTSAAARIVSAQGSAIVTDYPPATPPLAVNFIRRNRIIAGMSRGVILTESRQRGGGIITARLALSYNRDVHVLPGRIDDPRSQGCNMLLREQIAAPITDLSLLVESLGLGSTVLRKKSDVTDHIDRIFAETLDKETLTKFKSVGLRIKTERGITTEELARTLDISYHDVSWIVGMLESAGIISIDLLQRCSINVKIV